MSKSTRWCFTLNNPSIHEQLLLEDVKCNYIVYGREVGTSGTPHLQGFVVFSEQKRLSGVQRILSRAHWEVAGGNDQQASDYCKKDGDFVERGLLKKKGERSDLKKIYEAIADGISETEIAETYPGQYSRYYKAFGRYKMLKENTKKKAIPNHILYEWQEAILREVKEDADERTILFVVDGIGNNGKSWFCNYLLNSLDFVQLMDPGKKADMAYELRQDVRILLVDCARSRTEVLDYHFLEKVKDGVVFSPKYESVVKFLKHNVHVIVFMNQNPDYTKLSSDRYRLLTISPVPDEEDNDN